MVYRHSTRVMDSLTLNVYSLSLHVPDNRLKDILALLNVIETLLNATYLYLAHVAAWPPATLVGFAAAVMTLSKTVLYWAQEYYCGYCMIGHNSAWNLVTLWIIPNGCVHTRFKTKMCIHIQNAARLWIVIPGFIVARLGKDLAQSLNFAAKASTAKKAK